MILSKHLWDRIFLKREFNVGEEKSSNISKSQHYKHTMKEKGVGSSWQ